jgi:hypothetical protein
LSDARCKNYRNLPQVVMSATPAQIRSRQASTLVVEVREV